MADLDPHGSVIPHGDFMGGMQYNVLPGGGIWSKYLEIGVEPNLDKKQPVWTW
jgi:hypothetical protein